MELSKASVVYISRDQKQLDAPRLQENWKSKIESWLGEFLPGKRTSSVGLSIDIKIRFFVLRLACSENLKQLWTQRKKFFWLHLQICPDTTPRGVHFQLGYSRSLVIVASTCSKNVDRPHIMNWTWYERVVFSAKKVHKKSPDWIRADWLVWDPVKWITGFAEVVHLVERATAKHHWGGLAAGHNDQRIHLGQNHCPSYLRKSR